MIERRENKAETASWLIRAITSGFVATATMTVILALAYWLALVLGRPEENAPLFLRWIWALANNVVTRDVATSLPLAAMLNFVAGIGWALVYAVLVEPRLRGPAWRQGLVFSLIPWAFSVVVFLPLLGGGLFGADLGAGPLPALGNLVLHLIYGAVLGVMYAPASDMPAGERPETVNATELATLIRSGQTTALGIVVGLIVGAFGSYALDVALIRSAEPLMTLFLGALVGSALGALVGSFWGLSPERR